MANSFLIKLFWTKTCTNILKPLLKNCLFKHFIYVKCL
jgi:hypothetical protein